MKVLVVGSGLAGASAARALYDQGHGVEVVDAAQAWGGQLRSSTVNGIRYEPHGAHIFHTNDAEVWAFATAHVDMLAYQHVVKTEVNGRTLSWPPQVSELKTLPEWPTIAAELDRLPADPRTENFEVWCVDLMGSTLYGWFIEPYTRKQWGVDPTALSSHWAPKRIELRDDDYRGLFRDPFQGYPRDGYDALIDSLLAPIPVSMGERVTMDTVEQVSAGFDSMVLTIALDDFFADELGALPWRGVRLVNRYYPGVDRLLEAPVVNHPGLDQPYTRRIESKQMYGGTQSGTVVSEEYPGADAKHYPIDDVAGENRRLANAYRDLLADRAPLPTVTAGRLATYTYINMDQAIRQGLTAAGKLAQLVSV